MKTSLGTYFDLEKKKVAMSKSKPWKRNTWE
jgi:hypothetical protein